MLEYVNNLSRFVNAREPKPRLLKQGATEEKPRGPPVSLCRAPSVSFLPVDIVAIPLQAQLIQESSKLFL